MMPKENIIRKTNVAMASSSDGSLMHVFNKPNELKFSDATSDVYSAFHNSTGYNYLLTQLMVKVAQSSINRNILEYYDAVWELYGWINNHFTEETRKEVEKGFNDARGHINLMNQAHSNRLDMKEREHYSCAKNKLDELKHFIVRVMGEQNLLSPMNKKNTMNQN